MWEKTPRGLELQWCYPAERIIVNSFSMTSMKTISSIWGYQVDVTLCSLKHSVTLMAFLFVEDEFPEVSWWVTVGLVTTKTGVIYLTHPSGHRVCWGGRSLLCAPYVLLWSLDREEAWLTSWVLVLASDALKLGWRGATFGVVMSDLLSRISSHSVGSGKLNSPSIASTW